MIIIIVSACLLLPTIILWQAKQVKKNAIRLPEADGSRESLVKAPLSFLHIGESTVAGVGVKNIQDGLSTNIINALNESSTPDICWQILGVNGATIAETQSLETNITAPDILLITFGVNDTTKFTSKREWLTGIQRCVKKFSAQNTQVFFTSVPPMHKFPLLPVPLRYLLGWRSAFLDRHLNSICQDNGWHHLHIEFGSSEDLMAEDGYHPNAKGYAIWGEEVAKIIRQVFKKTD